MDILSDPLGTLTGLADATGLGVRGCLGVLGAALALAGARLHTLAIIAPGIVLGLVLGLMLPEAMEPGLRLGLAVLFAGVGALALRALEAAAIRIFGSVLFLLLVWGGWPLIVGGPAPWPAVGGAALAGLLLFPAAFRFLIKPLTALFGGLLIATALGHPGHPLIVGAVAVVGSAVQLSLFKGSKKKEED